MRISALGAKNVKNQSVKLRMYSKQWSPGDTLRVFYPIFWEDGSPQLAVGAVWGHKVNDIKAFNKKLKTTFIPSLTPIDIETATPIGAPDITYQFSRIARAFVNGQKAREEQNIQEKPWPSESARKEALRDLENKYDDKGNLGAVKPVIGRLTYMIVTEVGSLKIVNGVPDPKSYGISIFALSNERIDMLNNMLNDPKYAPAEGDNFFEVEWKYPVDTDKARSGNAATCSGLTAEYRFAAQFASNYDEFKNSTLSRVSVESEDIIRHAVTNVSEDTVREAIKSYSMYNSEYIESAPEDDTKILEKSIPTLRELGILDMLKPRAGKTVTPTAQRILDAAADFKDEASEFMESLPAIDTSSAINTLANNIPKMPDPTPVMPSPISPIPDLNISAPTIQSLTQNANFVQMSESELMDVDLTDNNL